MQIEGKEIVTVNNIQNVCRVCLQEADANVGRSMSEIFESNNRFPQLSIAKCLREICSLEISEQDQYTKLICSVCRPRLQNAFYIRSVALRSQQAINKILDTTRLARKSECMDAEILNIEYIDPDALSLESEAEEFLNGTSNQASKESEITCCICRNKKFHNKHMLKIHSIHEHRPEQDDIAQSRIIFCNVCYIQFKNDDAANLHKRNNPSACLMRKCIYCRSNFSNTEELEKHSRECHSDKQFKCCGCDFRCNSRLKLVAHSLVHKNMNRKQLSTDELAEEEQYQCVVCFERFPSWLDMRNHETSPYHNEQNTRNESVIQETLEISGDNTSCKLDCSETGIFENEYLRGKIATIGLIKPKNAGTFNRTRSRQEKNSSCKKKEYHCELCSARLQTPQSLRVHMKTHSNEKYKCRYCPAVYITKSGRKNHEIRHTNQSQYKCQFCGWRTNHRQRYIGHYETVHMTDADRVFSCIHCPQRFSKDHFLSNHIFYVHRLYPSDSYWNHKFYPQTKNVAV